MAEMSSGAINNLPDSAFAYIESGGSKDSEGKTVPRSLRHFPIHDAAHVRNALARAPQSPFGEKAMPKIRAAAKKLGIDVGGEQQQQPERALPEPLIDKCVRATNVAPTLERRTGATMPTLVGELAVFNQWGHVKSRLEGEFMERLVPGSFTKTLREHRTQMRCIFQHGEHPTVGMFPLGPIEHLEQRADKVEYGVALFDTAYNHEILPGLEAGQYQSSFTFRAPKDKKAVTFPTQRSDYNPDRLPEVTVQELRMFEFGPCLFPVYTGTSAGLRSVSDFFYLDRLIPDPALRAQVLTSLEDAPILTAATALSNERAEHEAHSGGESRNVQPITPVRKFQTSEDFVEWLNSKT